MDALFNASRDSSLQALFNELFQNEDVIGFALRPHPRYLSLARGVYGDDSTPDSLLGIGKVPGWEEECRESGLPSLKPIYVALYFRANPSFFPVVARIPRVTESGYLVIPEFTDPFVGLADRGRHDPLEGGISAAAFDPKAATNAITGTLGGFVTDSSKGETFLVSCEHVLGPLHSDVLQQSPGDGGVASADVVGGTCTLGGLTATFPPASVNFNTVDAAMAKVSGRKVHHSIRSLGSINGVVPRKDVDTEDNVIFVGKESDFQQARVLSLIARIKVMIDGVQFVFSDVFEIEFRSHQYFGKLARPGDSGAWVVLDKYATRDQVCGILFSGNSRTALCCFFETALERLESVSGRKLSVKV